MPVVEFEPTHMPGGTRRIDLSVWSADAVVLYDWLMSVDIESVPIEHRAHKQALVDLLVVLETSVVPPTSAEVEAARHDVSRDMDW